MSWFSSFWSSIKQNYGELFKNIVGGGVASSLVNKYTGVGLTGAEREANAFTAEQAQIDRDWQTDMSNTAFQRQVADMQRAGVNPALMYGGAGSSGASTPSGASASSVSPQTSDLLPMLFNYKLGKHKIDTDVNLRNRELDIDAYNARTRRIEAESNIKRNNAYIANLAEVTRGLGISNDIAEGTKQIKILQAKADLDLTQKQVDQIDQGIEESSWRIGLLIQQTTESQMKSALYATEERLKALDVRDKAIYLLYADKLYKAEANEAYSEAEDAALKFAYDQKLLSTEAADLALKVLKSQSNIADTQSFKATLVRDLVDNRKIPSQYQKKGLKQSDWEAMRKDLLRPVYLSNFSTSFSLYGSSVSSSYSENPNTISH